ncbi:MAG: DUF1015 domain-containing protein [Chitinispirillaceae bacterium]
MAEVKAFRGFRYSLASPEDLGAYTAPPYDMIDDAKIEQLYSKNPHNTVRIIQNRPEKSDSSNRDRHARAAQFLDEWIKRGVLVQDDKDSVYIYQQKFTIDMGGKQVTHERTGVCVLVKLVDFEEQVVFPHEYTLSGPKADRYELMEATHSNPGQIFGLATDESGDLFSLIKEMKGNLDPEGTFTDENGVVHTLFRCTDDDQIGRFTSLMGSRTILIADGHHRYETALNFYKDSGNPAFSHVMMTLVSTADPGLVIRPFHRLVRRTEQGNQVDMKAELARFFDLTSLGKVSSERVNQVLADDKIQEIVYWDCASGELTGLKLNEEGERFLSETLPERSAEWKHLDVSKINAIVINKILGLPLDGHVLHDVVNYVNDVNAGKERLSAEGQFYGGFFIRPVSISVINETVKGGERMPQKSTNFFPKLYAGLVINRMD